MLFSSKLKAVLLICLVLSFSCQLKKEKIQDEFLFLEAVIQPKIKLTEEKTTKKAEIKEQKNLQNKETKEENKEEELLYSLISPPLLLDENTVYIRDKEKFFWLNYESGKAYVLFPKRIGEEKEELEEKQKEQTDFLTLWIRKKNLNFQKKEFYPSVQFYEHVHSILDFIPGANGDFYLVSLLEKEDKNYKSILHFDQKGTELAQIGIFDRNQHFVDMNLDEDGFLNVVLVSYDEKHSSKNYKGKRYELFRYSPKGELDFHDSDLVDRIPTDEGFQIFLEEVNFFPKSQDLAFLASYYSKKDTFFEPRYKKLFKWNPKQEKVLVEITKIKEKYLSLLGVSQEREIYLIGPLANSSDLWSKYEVEVWNERGGQTEKKVLVLERSIREAQGFFSGKSGEILVFKKQHTKGNIRRFQAFFYQ